MLKLNEIDWMYIFTQQLLLLGRNLTLFLILIFCLFILQRLVFSLTLSLAGKRIIYLSAWIGAPVHELSHAIFCLIFSHKIQRVVLLNLHDDDTLGYVSHSYNNRNLWQIMGNFFIGIAPLFGGLFAIYLLTYFLLENSSALFDLLAMSVFENINSIYPAKLSILSARLFEIIKSAYLISPLALILWAYCCAAISLHLSPSKEDLKGGWVGFLVFIVLCLFVMTFNQLIGQNWFSGLGMMINVSSMLYLIGIVLASLLLLFLLICKSVLLMFKH
jgi:hypothetical protein